MARRRKSVDQQIADIEAQKSQYQAKIDGYKVKISDLDGKIQTLQESQKQKELESLLDVIKKSGRTPEEVIQALNPTESSK